MSERLVVIDFNGIKNKFESGVYTHIDDHFNFSNLLLQLLTPENISDCSFIDEIACYISDDVQEKEDKSLYEQVYDSCLKLCSDIGQELYITTNLTEEAFTGIKKYSEVSNIAIVSYEQ